MKERINLDGKTKVDCSPVDYINFLLGCKSRERMERYGWLCDRALRNYFAWHIILSTKMAKPLTLRKVSTMRSNSATALSTTWITYSLAISNDSKTPTWLTVYTWSWFTNLRYSKSQKQWKISFQCSMVCLRRLASWFSTSEMAKWIIPTSATGKTSQMESSEYGTA